MARPGCSRQFPMTKRRLVLRKMASTTPKRRGKSGILGPRFSWKSGNLDFFFCRGGKLAPKMASKNTKRRGNYGIMGPKNAKKRPFSCAPVGAVGDPTAPIARLCFSDLFFEAFKILFFSLKYSYLFLLFFGIV